ncbi:MAG: serine/threonine-protein kinase [bacterium]
MGFLDTPQGLDERPTLQLAEGGEERVNTSFDHVDTLSMAPMPVSDDERYEPGKLLGEGGMGAVWLSRDRQIGRRVAMKVVKEELVGSSTAVRRFYREARVQGQLEHPSVVPVYDLGVDEDGAAFFTMKRIRGVTLEEIITELRDLPDVAERTYGRRRLLSAFSQVCLAVDFAHRRGVIHRDLKPENIMLGDFGEVYVLDWGVAKILAEREETQETIAGIDVGEHGLRSSEHTLFGTPAFMAPEQLADEPGVNKPGVDVYSLGAILFELLTLKVLNDGATMKEVMAQSLGGVDARTSVRAPELEIPPELEEICVRATARRPQDRFVSARALQIAVDRFLDGQRNLELRKELSQLHAVSAVQAVVRAAEAKGAGLEERRVAMQEIGRSLALDPQNVQAVESMLTLLSRPPKELPPEVMSEIQRSEEDQWRWTARVAAIAYFSLAMYLPLFVWTGIRSVMAIALYEGLAVLSALCALYVGFSPHPRPWMLLTVMVTSTLCQASTSAFFGPLVLTPALVATNTAGFAILLRGGFRLFAILFACVVIYTLVMLELLGFPLAHYVFDETGMVIKPAAIGLKLAPTVTLLSIAALATILTTAISVSRIRDSLSEAERKLYLYAWQIRQLVPTVLSVPRGGAAPRPSGRPSTTENSAESG